MSKIVIIGSGFSGLSAAAYLSSYGHEVHVFEKNPDVGGRARQLKTDSGYIFDMGPSWYWMPDVFENFFNDFGYSASEFYKLKLLDPSFEIIFGAADHISIPENFEALKILFESIETGSALKLGLFMEEAAIKYRAALDNLMHKPGLSIFEFAKMDLIKAGFKLNLFTSFSKHVRKYFSNPRLIALMEFPVLFLGAMPQETPALYSLMNYAGLKLGTWYPMGGFGKVIEAMTSIAKTKGSIFHLDAPIERIVVENKLATNIIVKGESFNCDAIIASADYHHVESTLLPSQFKNYKESYWNKRVLAPSCLIYYLGINKKIKKLAHHNLFFDESLYQHSLEIYKNPQWPTKPLFYVCCPSKSDDSVAPYGHENIFLLMPLASGLKDNETLRETYFQVMIERLEKQVEENISLHIDFKKSYCVNDFIIDYNSYKGNAYGLANTLFQTAIFKPKLRNAKVKNIFYSGQLTVPGPGVPPSIISGKLAAEQLHKYMNPSSYEINI